MQDDQQASNRENRRSALKSIGAASVGVGGVIGSATPVSAGSCQIPSGDSDATEEGYRKKQTNADYYEYTSGSDRYDRLTDLQSGLIYKGSEYSQVQERWVHSFRTGGYSKTMRKLSYESKDNYELKSAHDYVRTEINNTDPARAALYTTSNPSDVAITPAPSSDGEADVGSAAFTLLTAILGTTNAYVGVAISAAQIISALTYTDKPTDGSKVDYKWDYGSGNRPCEEGHFVRFTMRGVDGSETANLGVTDEVSYNRYGGVRNEFNMTVDAVPDGLTATTSGTSSNRQRPQPGDEGYTGWLVRNGFAERISNDDIQREQVAEIAEGGPVFRATSPVVRTTKASSEVER